MPVRWMILWLGPIIISHRALFGLYRERIASDDRLSALYMLPIASILLLWLEADAGYPIQKEQRKLAGTISALGVMSGLLGETLFQGVWGNLAQWPLIVLSLAAGFAFCYGWGSLRARIAAFSLLALSAPPPDAVLTAVEAFFQSASANIAEHLFGTLGVSYIRQGMSFSLPGLMIEVARECSGVRSAIGLLVTAFVLGRIVMRTNVSRVALCLWALPVAMVKNGIRIAVLATLGVWVSPDVLRGPLHRYGGVVFFVVALCLFAPAVLFLQNSERKRLDLQQARIDIK